MKARNDQKVFQVTEQKLTMPKEGIKLFAKAASNCDSIPCYKFWPSIILAESSVHLCSVQVLNIEWVAVQNLQMAKPHRIVKLH